MSPPSDDQLLPFQRLDAYRVALELLRRVTGAKIRDSELRDQATRAAKSTFLRVCEGLPLDGVAMRRKYFREAQGSLHETIGAMDASRVLGAVAEADAEAVQELGFRLRALVALTSRARPPQQRGGLASLLVEVEVEVEVDARRPVARAEILLRVKPHGAKLESPWSAVLGIPRSSPRSGDNGTTAT